MAAAKLTQSALAKAWRCSQPAISKLVDKGMPLTSEADARAWKEAQQERRSRTDISDEARLLDLEERRFRLRKAEHEFEKSVEAVLPVAQFEAALGSSLVQFRSAVNALPGRGAGKVVSHARIAVVTMLRAALTEKQFELVERKLSATNSESIDFSAIEEILQNEVDLVLRTLERCDYLQPADE